MFNYDICAANKNAHNNLFCKHQNHVLKTRIKQRITQVKPTAIFVEFSSSMEAFHLEENVTDILPVEILQRILTWLPREDLLTASLVNKKLLSVVNGSILWKEFSLNLEKLYEANSFQEFLEIERFQSVQVLRIDGDTSGKSSSPHSEANQFACVLVKYLKIIEIENQASV